MATVGSNPARDAVLEELQRSAIEIYGEERAAEGVVQAGLGLTATAIWRVGQETLDLAGPPPVPNHWYT